MVKINLTLEHTIVNGETVTFEAPCDCSAVDGLRVTYPTESGEETKEFCFRDAHNNDLTGLGNLFAEGAVVKVILRTETGCAYIQNADTNSYLEANLWPKVGDIVTSLRKDFQDKVGDKYLPCDGRYLSPANYPNLGEVAETTIGANWTNLNNYTSGSPGSNYYYHMQGIAVATDDIVYFINQSNHLYKYQVSTGTVSAVITSSYFPAMCRDEKGNVYALGGYNLSSSGTATPKLYYTTTPGGGFSSVSLGSCDSGKYPHDMIYRDGKVYWIEDHRYRSFDVATKTVGAYVTLQDVGGGVNTMVLAVSNNKQYVYTHFYNSSYSSDRYINRGTAPTSKNSSRKSYTSGNYGGIALDNGNFLYFHNLTLYDWTANSYTSKLSDNDVYGAFELNGVIYAYGSRVSYVSYDGGVSFQEFSSNARIWRVDTSPNGTLYGWYFGNLYRCDPSIVLPDMKNHYIRVK